ncbi:hypothetical protein HY3_13690 [Hyphomonas pacifica]|uniref:Uncharacterized protein n=1 Tax=Hyphomonas pacifica TaxID=1280941 RepID=A0A062TX36_9PROT|nr:hypothetical protein HY2_13435 [Hyphomonas pacifica]RAN33007.1 hypothetical protein HY3_13690 [Hyphomonas pacifica]RAN37563.1 hypothetical protein HY11_08735 [Hyphomonas pacifica]
MVLWIHSTACQEEIVGFHLRLQKEQKRHSGLAARIVQKVRPLRKMWFGWQDNRGTRGHE